MSNEEKKKKVNEKDLETVSGGCGTPKRRFDIGDKVRLISDPEKHVFVIISHDYDKVDHKWCYSIQLVSDPSIVLNFNTEHQLVLA